MADEPETKPDEPVEATPEAPEAAAEEKPKPKRAPRKKAEPKADAETEAAETAEEKPKPKRAPRKKASEQDVPQEAVAAEAEATDAAADEEKPKPRARGSRGSRARKPAEATAEKAEKAEAKPDKPARPATRRRRDAERTDGTPTVVRAQARYVRTSARKARLVCDHIRGKSVDEARAILAYTPRAVARDWSKLLESAVANAENNHELVGDELKVLAAFADEGPTLKRFQPRAMGRATRIRKRTSHLTIQLTPKG